MTKLNILLVTLLTLLISGLTSINAQSAVDNYTGSPKLAFSPTFGSLDQGEIASFDVVVEDIQGENVNAAKLVVRASEGVTITKIEGAPGMLSLKPFVAGDYAKIDISKEQAYFTDGDVLATITVEAETDITLPEEPDGGGTDNGGSGGNNNGGTNNGSGNNNGGGSGMDTTAEEGVYFGEGTQIGDEVFENLPETFDDGSDSDLTGFPDRSVDSSPVSTPVDDDGESILDKVTGNLPMVVGLCLVLLLILAVLMMLMKRKKNDDSDSSGSDFSTPVSPSPMMTTDPIGPSPAPMSAPSSPATPVTPPSAPVMPTPPAPTTPVMPAPPTATPSPAPVAAPEQPGPISETVVKP